jgi:hypothetical protein
MNCVDKISIKKRELLIFFHTLELESGGCRPHFSLKGAGRAAGLDTSGARGSRGLGGVVETTSRSGVAVRPHARRPRATPAKATLGTATVEPARTTGTSRVWDTRWAHAGSSGVGS